MSYDQIARSKLIITVDSTIGIEAISLGVRTVFIKHNNNKNLFLFEDLSIIHDCINYKDFELCVNRALMCTESRIKFSKDHIIPQFQDIKANEIIYKRLMKFL